MNDKQKLNQISSKLRKLHKAGMSQSDIVDVISDMKLPLKFHLAIMGNYSKYVEGRLV